MSERDNSHHESVQDEPEYDVERILAENVVEGKTFYLVKWLNYDDAQCTWEPAESFLTPATLADWKRQLENNDTLDEHELARLQQRMDAYQNAEEEEFNKKALKPKQASPQPTTKRPRPSASPERSSPKKPRHKSPITKKGIAHVVSPRKISVTPSAMKHPQTQMNQDSSGPSNASIMSTPLKSSKPVSQSHRDQQTERNADQMANTTPLRNADDNSNSKAQAAEKMAGKRFKNLQHQNNYFKKSRQEPAPDMSKLDLRAPDEWTSTSTRTMISDANAATRTRDSPLFVPEDEQLSAGRILTVETASPSGREDHLPSSTKQSDPKSMLAKAVTSQSVKVTTPVSAPVPVEDNDSQTKDQAAITKSPSPRTSPDKELGTKGSSNVSAAQSQPPLKSRHSNNTGPGNDSINMQPVPSTEPSYRTSLQWRRQSLPSQADRPKLNRAATDVPSTTDSLIMASNGRAYKKGEVIINLRFGDHEVGDVRFTHLPWWASGKILRLKDPTSRILSFHFDQRYVMDVATFSALSHQIDNHQQGVATVEPYEDTHSAVESLTKHLEANDLGAIWEYPEPAESLLIVLYSSRAPSWQHLGVPAIDSSNSRLHLALLNTVPGFKLANDPMTRTENNLPLERVETSRRRVGPTRSLLQHSTTGDEIPTFQSPIEARSPIATPGVKTAATMSRSSFSANFNDMICGLDMTQKKPRVFISFARSHPADANAVKEWLSKHVNSRFIFADDQPDDWAEYQQESTDKPGMILFHERYPSYCELTHLHKFLRSPFVFCYNLSFVQTENNQSNEVTRIFPRGTALCITEGTLINESEEALQAMIWFRDQSYKKVQYWKLILPPDPFSWLLRQALETSGDIQKRYLGMVENLHKLRTRSFDALWEFDRTSNSAADKLGADPNKFMGCTQSEEFVVSPVGLYGYSDWAEADMSDQSIQDRDNSLVESFAAWAVLNVTKYRKYMVIDAKHSNKTEKRACHIWFRDPVKFVEQEKKKP